MGLETDNLGLQLFYIFYICISKRVILLQNRDTYLWAFPSVPITSNSRKKMNILRSVSMRYPPLALIRPLIIIRLHLIHFCYVNSFYIFRNPTLYYDNPYHGFRPKAFTSILLSLVSKYPVILDWTWFCIVVLVVVELDTMPWSNLTRNYCKMRKIWYNVTVAQAILPRWTFICPWKTKVRPETTTNIIIQYYTDFLKTF